MPLRPDSAASVLPIDPDSFYYWAKLTEKWVGAFGKWGLTFGTKQKHVTWALEIEEVTHLLLKNEVFFLSLSSLKTIFGWTNMNKTYLNEPKLN